MISFLNNWEKVDLAQQLMKDIYLCIVVCMSIGGCKGRIIVGECDKLDIIFGLSAYYSRSLYDIYIILKVLRTLF